MCDTHPLPAPAHRLRILDALRGLAALYVVIGHARYLLHEGLANYHLHPEAYVLWQKIAAYALGFFGWGHEAVILFFVLSGFAIHLRYARELGTLKADAKFRLGSYLWRRGKRLYPPLLLALVLTLGLDTLGVYLHFAIHPSIGPVTHDTRTLLGNLAFGMDNWGGTPFATYGTDKPLWSLRYEAAFYLLYPLLWLINRKNTGFTLGATLLMAWGILLLPKSWSTPYSNLLLQPLTLLLVWWLGGFLADIYVGRVRLPLRPLGLLMLCLPLGLRLPGSDAALLPHPYATWMLGLGFFGLMAAGLAWHQKIEKWRVTEWMGKLGDCSYTLYVIHMPILVLMGGWLISRSPNAHLPTNPIWVLPGAALCIGLAWAAHFVVEKPFIGSRRKKKAGTQ